MEEKAKTSDAQLRAIKKYDDAHTKQYHLKLNTETDRDIIERFGQVDGVQTYIKKLIREDIWGKTGGKNP